MKQGFAAVLVILLVVSVLALGVIFAYQYGMFAKTEEPAPQVEVNQEVSVEDRSNEIDSVNKGDKVSDIEDDLNKTDIDSLDEEVLGVKSEASGL